MRFLSFLVLMLGVLTASAQKMAAVAGTITDAEGNPIPFVTVYIEDLADANVYTYSAEDGRYKIDVPAEERFTLAFSLVSYKKEKITGIKLEEGEVRQMDMTLASDENVIEEVVVRTWESVEADAQRISYEDIKEIPTTTMNLESMLQFLAVGVTAGTGGELTSQYSVRGGNYDENLIYVNGFEIYRPMLIRSGQQEGLTFPNPDMLLNLAFSSGGFKAEYGDKMSSVLDVKYRRPTRPIEASVSASLLGASAYIGGAVYKDSAAARKQTSPYRFTYAIGARYKTTQYLLGGLSVKGQYVPNFYDIQGNFIYDINPFWQVELLGNYNNSIYRLVPYSGESVTGLFNQALRLTTLFDGKEISNFENFMVGTAVTYKVPRLSSRDSTSRMRVRLMASHFQTYENERIDIKTFYRLDEIETGLGDDNFGEVIGTLAYGETHQYARNFLKAKVTQVQLVNDLVWEGAQELNDSTTREHEIFFKWGAGYKNEIIDDQLKEWFRYDSLGYSVPNDTTALPVYSYLNTTAKLNSHRVTAFAQNSWDIKLPKHHFRMTLGARLQYWTLNKEFFAVPRFELFYTPRRFTNPMSDETTKTKDLTFKLAAGMYYQPPFYRELRDLDGNLHTDVRAQKSAHFLGGVVWDFVMFKRPFKFVSEAYYKHQWDLNPYDVENVRVRYYGGNYMKGYVAGIDFRLNGELVDGLESWVNLSFLRARERFDSVQHKIRRFDGSEIDTFLLADVPKPTDQLVIFSMYFQDYFPKAPWFKVNLAFTVGTGLPYGIPRNNVEYRNTYRYPHYHRIDLGFSFALWNQKQYITKHREQYKNFEEFQRKSRHAFKKLRSAWLSIEAFNLTNNKNVASYTWVKDFTNRSYAIPNTLTSWRINVRLRVDF